MSGGVGVSVVMPVRNGALYLGEAIARLIAGNDMQTMNADTRAVLTNPEAIAGARRGCLQAAHRREMHRAIH